MTNQTEDYKGVLPSGWTGGQHTQKWWRGRTVHLYRLRKPCAQCSQEMSIDVTKAALDGTAKNAGLHLKRCKLCRAISKAQNTSSRPKVKGEVPYVHVPENVDEQLRMANATMKAELEGLYAENKELRTRLSKYELTPAIEAIANGVIRMPWEN